MTATPGGDYRGSCRDAATSMASEAGAGRAVAALPFDRADPPVTGPHPRQPQP
jgi:hypothetical protein